MALLTYLIIACAHIASCGSLVDGASWWQWPGLGAGSGQSLPGPSLGRHLLQGDVCPQFDNYNLFQGKDHNGDDISCEYNNVAAAEAACNADSTCLAFHYKCTKKSIGQLRDAAPNFCYYESKSAPCQEYAGYDLFMGLNHYGDDIRCGLGGIDAAEAACSSSALCLAFNDDCIKQLKGSPSVTGDSTSCYYEKKGCPGGPGTSWCNTTDVVPKQLDCNGDGSPLDSICISSDSSGRKGVSLWAAGCAVSTNDPIIWKNESNGLNPNWPNADVGFCSALGQAALPPTPPPPPVPGPIVSPPPPLPAPSPLPAPPPVPVASPPTPGVTAGVPTPPPQDATSTTIGVIVGTVIGGVAAVVLLSGVAWWAFKRRRTARDADSNLASGLPDAKPADIESILPGQKSKLYLTAESSTAGNTAGPTMSSSGGGMTTSSTLVTDQSDDYKTGLLKSMNIPWDSITIGKVLGAGGFGTVVRGEWAGNLVAVKMLNVEKLSDSVRNSLRQEALAMCALRHPCIAHMYGVVDEGDHQALVMRYYEMGTVAAAMSMDGFYSMLDVLERLKMARQVAIGMCYLHARQPTPMIHGDLKTANLLIEKNNRHRGVVITDFGLCGLGAVAESGALTLTISPPEVLLDQRAPRTMAGDVYAFGIVLLEIMTGTLVFKGMRSDQIKEAVLRGLRPGLSEVPDDIAPLIKDCWAQEAAARPTFVEVEKRLQAAIQALETEKKSEEESTADVHTTHAPATFNPATTTITDVYAWTSTQAGTTRAPRW